MSRVAVRTPRAGLPHRPRLLAPVLITLVVVLVLLAVGIALFTDYLWFDSVDYTEVFSTVLRTKLLLFVLFGVLMAVAVGANIYLAYRLRPPFRPMSLEQQNLERYRLAVEPYLTPLLVLISAVLGVFAGLSAAGRWQTWLLWRNSTSFGVKDPQFHKDVSFYVMTYPMLRFALGFLLATLVLAVIATAATHYLFGGLRLQTVGEKVSPAARAHLSVLLGLIVLTKAVAYYLDRFGLVFSHRGFVQGAGYTDVNAVLPGKNILIGVAVICSVLFFANVRVRNVLLPGGALGLLVIAAVLLGGILPAFTQTARVKPNEVARESTYIDRNIKATRTAYGIDDVAPVPYGAAPPPVADAVNLKSPPNARLLDPNQLDGTFKQLQQRRNYFGVTNQLDIDRYPVKNAAGVLESEDFIVAAREVDQRGLTADKRNWVNEALTYTHGNGLIAARADEKDAEGRPIFRDGTTIPSLQVDQPRIYFGELSPGFSVVNTTTPEVDGPAGGDDSNSDQTSHYDGPGGVQLNSAVKKLAFALKFREPNFLLSGAITSKSRVMYDRNPADRVKKVAPFLEVDQDPYPAVVNGKIVWIVDGYTTTNHYPYSQSREFGQITQDSQTGQQQPRRQVNYIRNSVKATVDAYTGAVTLYRNPYGARDPILEAWNKAFGGSLVKDMTDEADPDQTGLREHLRYPEDLFKVQRDLLSQYHVQNPAVFFSGEDAWSVPTDPAQDLNEKVATATTGTTVASTPPSIDLTADGLAQPPYYSLLNFPGDGMSRFRLSTSFVFRGRPNLSAFASVSSDPASYGKIDVLSLPKDGGPAGPGQVANQFLTNPAVASKLFQYRNTNNGKVTFGNLLTLPLNQGLLYVQPVFVQVTGAAGFPTLNQVLVAYGNGVAAAPTFGEALTDLLKGTAGATPVTGGNGVTPTPTASAAPGVPTTPSALPTDVAGLVQQASTAFAAGQAALQKSPPDYAEYGRQQQILQAALTRLSQQAPTPAPTPTR